VISAVADTHAALWHLFGDSRLSNPAVDFIDRAAALRRRIVVSSIIEKGRLPASAYDDLRSALSDPGHVLKEAPFTIEIVDAMRNIPRATVPDMPDRIVAATALYFGVPVISRDHRIQSSAVQTIW
jgi:PIN domain nuclease of toxin-antitoxin system